MGFGNLYAVGFGAEGFSASCGLLVGETSKAVSASFLHRKRDADTDFLDAGIFSKSLLLRLEASPKSFPDLRQSPESLAV